MIDEIVSLGFEDIELSHGMTISKLPGIQKAYQQGKFRCSGDIRIDQFRDIRDLIFEAALHYRFFSAEDPSGDFAGIAAGVKNDSFGFTPGGSDESYEIQYGAVFTELDLSILKITGGYAFGGRERFGDSLSEESGDGYFLTFQGMYQF